MFPKAHAAAYVMMALRGLLQRFTIPFIITVLTSLSRAKAFDIKTMGAGLDAIKHRMGEIAEKRKRIMKPLMWSDLLQLGCQ